MPQSFTKIPAGVRWSKVLHRSVTQTQSGVLHSKWRNTARVGGMASIFAWLMDGLYVQVCVCCDKTVSGAMFSSDNCRNYFSIWTSFSISIKILLVNEKTSRVYTPCCINQCKAKDCKDLLLSGCGSVLAALRPCHTPTRGASTILIVPWCRLPYTEDNHIKIRSIIHFNVLPNK